ncbi:glycosyltransferase family 8 protein [Gelatoporia subvermispora B]|uniref:Glycosyltransferase family 8 protein n=1 Tax=Ceriporiopsis subvermispora (strain B) TaxID=914234 RepID=M2RH31_CERS8|nr:glycosyltransferase family 8 protein [Gelatoporia subvermispora B]
MVFSRYKGYTLLWPTTERQRTWHWSYPIILLSTVVNVALLYLWCSSRVPSPLDSYQHLNTQPLLNADALDALNDSPLTPDNAVVTSLYTDAYATAVATLGHSLNAANSTARRIVLYLPSQVSPRALCIASASGFEPLAIPRIEPPHGSKGVYHRFVDQYSKLRLWTLAEHDVRAAVYLDADTLVRQNFDELFRLPYAFAAVPDVFMDKKGFSLMFNAGVLFLRPDARVFEDMLQKIETADFPARDAEQAFLNYYYGKETLRLPYAYNANLAIKQRQPALWDDLWHETRIVHYTLFKPFLDDREREVEIRLMEENVESKLGMQGGLFDQEIREWAGAWRETRRIYGDAFDVCERRAAGRQT